MPNDTKLPRWMDGCTAHLYVILLRLRSEYEEKRMTRDEALYKVEEREEYRMDAVEFIEKYREMCNYYDDCFGCPLFSSGCINMKEGAASAEQVIQIVNDWEDRHRVIKTNGDKVLSVIPANIREEGKKRYDKYEEIKPDITYGNYTPIESFVGFFVPIEWWNAELEDNE